MAIELVNIGSAEGADDGESLREAFAKVNQTITEVNELAELKAKFSLLVQVLLMNGLELPEELLVGEGELNQTKG